MSIGVVFFGDSVSFGQHVSLHQCWVSRLAHELSTKYDVVITNSSVNGCTTRQALERISYDLSNLKMDIVTIQFGMNDCNYWITDRGVPRVSPESFKANMKEIIDRVRIFGAKVIFLVTNHPTIRNKENMQGANHTYQKGNESYNKIIIKVALEKTIEFINVEMYFRRLSINLEDVLCEDGLHLNERGHGIYLECVKPFIENAIKGLL